MKHLQTYRIFEAAQSLTPEQEEFLNQHTRGTWSVNPKTGRVDVQGNFFPWGNDLKDLMEIRFGAVDGDFSCSFNQLQSLEGAPTTVGGDFRCFNNELNSLEGAPTTVGGNFKCYDNRLESLEGAPETIGGEFHSDYIKIPKGKWSLETLADLWIEGTPKQKSLLAPLVDLEELQRRINENPEKMLLQLKGVLKHPHFQSLKWPSHLETERGLLSDLDDVGL